MSGRHLVFSRTFTNFSHHILYRFHRVFAASRYDHRIDALVAIEGRVKMRDRQGAL
jgi:hypothetical protein